MQLSIEKFLYKYFEFVFMAEKKHRIEPSSLGVIARQENPNPEELLATLEDHVKNGWAVHPDIERIIGRTPLTEEQLRQARLLLQRGAEIHRKKKEDYAAEMYKAAAEYVKKKIDFHGLPF